MITLISRMSAPRASRNLKWGKGCHKINLNMYCMTIKGTALQVTLMLHEAFTLCSDNKATRLSRQEGQKQQCTITFSHPSSSREDKRKLPTRLQTWHAQMEYVSNISTKPIFRARHIQDVIIVPDMYLSSMYACFCCSAVSQSPCGLGQE